MRRFGLPLLFAAPLIACSSSGGESGPPPDSCSNVPATAQITAWTADSHYCMQLRATATCPDPGAGDGGSGGADGGVPASTLYYTAGDGMLVVYHVGASGPVEADIYRVR